MSLLGLGMDTSIGIEFTYYVAANRIYFVRQAWGILIIRIVSKREKNLYNVNLIDHHWTMTIHYSFCILYAILGDLSVGNKKNSLSNHIPYVWYRSPIKMVSYSREILVLYISVQIKSRYDSTATQLWYSTVLIDIG